MGREMRYTSCTHSTSHSIYEMDDRRTDSSEAFSNKT